MTVHLLLGVPCAQAVERPSTSRVGTYQRARQLRESLGRSAPERRTRAQYDRVLDAFRAVYHTNPASSEASVSIFVVAELLAEEGRDLRYPKALKDSVAEYEFLRREYPGSRLRAGALLAEGEIYQRDLADETAAANVYKDFLREYPRDPLRVQAQQGLAQTRAADRAELRPSSKADAGDWAGQRTSLQGRTAQTSPSTLPRVPVTGLQESQQALSAKTHVDVPATGVSTSRPVVGQEAVISSHLGALQSDAKAGTEAARRGASLPQSQATVRTGPQQEVRMSAAAEQPSLARSDDKSLSTAVPAAHKTVARHTRLPLVTGVRHWSTPVYTRVAIDLQDEVQYEAARVPDPDRIFFDLHGARLSAELIGSSVQVTDDGFLKRIRVAQSSPDVARIVLDVSDVSDYSAFLLPNPYRLIIDIHGRKAATPQPGASSNLQAPSGPGAPSPMPDRRAAQAGASSSGQSSNAAQARGAVPNRTSVTTLQKQAASAGHSSGLGAQDQGAKATITSAEDVEALDRQPNKVQATRGPTSAPISASVAGAVAAAQPRASQGSVNASRPGISQGAQRAQSGTASGLPQNTIPATAAQPSSVGSTSLSRALGLKIGRIVVDAGHGGHDSGTLGPDGIEEKDVVLDVALRLGKLLKQRLGAEVIYTRADDTFIPLETRTAIANKGQADLFISIHANSSQDPEARGVETYYLSFTSSADALEVAARENAVSQQSIHQLADLVKKIAMQDKIEESREFASDVQRGLYNGLTARESQNAGLRDRGVKKAPFVVLIGANMPSILAEISFLTNPQDASQLGQPAYRQRIAESLYLGVARYVGGLNGVRLAENPGAVTTR